MTLPGNGTAKKVIATVIAALCIFLIMQVLGNSDRITAVETDMKGIKDALSRNRDEIQDNRRENRDDHKGMNDKLDAIGKEIRK